MADRPMEDTTMTDPTEPLAMCWRGHPFERGVAEDYPEGYSSPDWCNVCGESQDVLQEDIDAALSGPADATDPTPTRWTVDEDETYTLHGPKGTRIRCYQGGGTLPAPWLARDVIAAFGDADRLRQARELAVFICSVDEHDARQAISTLLDLLVDGGTDG